MSPIARATVVLALLPYACIAVTARATMGANPIRRVVDMLQNMQKEITAEGEKEEQLFDKFMCFCKTGGPKLQASIEDAGAKISQLESGIEGAGATKSQLAADVVQHKKDRDDAKTVIKEAESLRTKESGEFAKESAEDNANIGAMMKAIAALESGASGGFLQTSAVGPIRQLANTMDFNDADRQVLLSFLAQGQDSSEDYAPQSGEITGILKQMQDSTMKDLADASTAEYASINDFNALVSAKTRETNVLQKSIEGKTAREGEVGVALVNMEDDLDDTKSGLAEDTKVLANLEKSCKTREAEFEEQKQTRSEELTAVSETIKLLNDDDALGLFKKTLPSPSFLQIVVTDKEVREEARQVLRAKHGDSRLDFIALSLRGKKANFDEVTTMVDEMVTLLRKEQADDNSKGAYCNSEFDKAEDEQKVVEREISDTGKAIDENKEAIATTAEEIGTLVQGIKDLDTQVASATAQRKEENAVYKTSMAESNAAKEILGIALNRLNKFYNKALYKEAPKRELSESERITVNNGGTLAPTAPPGGIAGTGVTSFMQVSTRAAAPNKKSGGVVAMVNGLIAGLDKDIQEMEFDEKDAQDEYDTFMSDSKDKRATDSKTLAAKEGVKADLEASIEKSAGEKKTKKAEAYANAKYIMELHKECDWLLENLATRKEARDGEIDSLQKAKAVLAGADYSF